VHLPDASATDFRHVVDVNIPGSFLCVQAAARIMITQQQCNLQPPPTIPSPIPFYQKQSFPKSPLPATFSLVYG
jgi:hypothetical protein